MRKFLCFFLSLAYLSFLFGCTPTRNETSETESNRNVEITENQEMGKEETLPEITKPKTEIETKQEAPKEPEVPEEKVEESQETSEENPVNRDEPQQTPTAESEIEKSEEKSESKQTETAKEESTDLRHITEAGSYTFSGLITETVTVEAGSNDKVEIVLDNATIHNENGPAIYIKSADKVTVTVREGTNNTVSDGASYTVTDGETNLDGAIFSKADLTIGGTGTLTVNGNTKHGIVSKDDLIITDVTLHVTANNVALNGKDCVTIKNAAITLTAGSDGIRSDNTEDTTRGSVTVTDSTVRIVAGNDGIQAETLLSLANNTMQIQTGSGSSASLRNDTESYKGIKSAGNLMIESGTYTLDTQDDCIHANQSVTVNGGTFDLSSGDDGIHADADLTVNGGSITIRKSYEGIEGSKIVIAGGNIDLNASDDGLNAAGGNDSSATQNRPGRGWFESSTGEIIISGGYTKINASGDGIDSNGSVTVSGGITLVSGPTNNGNGAFDYASGATVTGGTLIALGSSGMAQGFSAAENQGAIFLTLSQQNANTPFAICDENGQIIASFTPPKTYQSVAVTAPKIQSGNTYTIVTGATVEQADANGYADQGSYTGGTVLETVTMTSNLYNVGGFGSMGGNWFGGGMGGGRGNRGQGNQMQPTQPTLPDGTTPQIPPDFGNTVPQMPFDGMFPDNGFGGRNFGDMGAVPDMPNGNGFPDESVPKTNLPPDNESEDQS